MTIQELITYAIIAMAAVWCLRRIYLSITHKRKDNCCASCTTDCPLKGRSPDRNEHRHCSHKTAHKGETQNK